MRTLPCTHTKINSKHASVSNANPFADGCVRYPSRNALWILQGLRRGALHPNPNTKTSPAVAMAVSEFLSLARGVSVLLTLNHTIIRLQIVVPWRSKAVYCHGLLQTGASPFATLTLAPAVTLRPTLTHTRTCIAATRSSNCATFHISHPM